jgi:hypothetical protein
MNRAVYPLFAIGVLIAGGVSCVLLDPVPELPKLPASAPRIEKELLDPRQGVRHEMPDHFVVPIRRLDPTQTLYWKLFVDWDPDRRDPPIDSDKIDGSPDGLNLIVVTAHLNGAVETTRMHTFEFVVAPDLLDTRISDPNLTDSVQWTYDPTPEMPPFDAAVLEAGEGGADAGDEAGLVPQ